MQHVIFCCEPEFSDRLEDELKRIFPSGHHVTHFGGWVDSTFDKELSGLPVAFARQLLVNPQNIGGLSISQTAEAVHEAVMAKLAGQNCPLRLHVFGAQQESGAVTVARGKLVVEALKKIWSKKQRSFLKNLVTDNDAPWLPGEALIQVALFSADQSWLSVNTAQERGQIGPTLSRYPAGLVICPQDKRPPARAYQKLLEAQRHLGHYICQGDSCVDLGASPGSWTYVALAQGGAVTALDRAPLRDDLMASPRLTFLQSDAFKFHPETPVDWLLSDIIAYPERLIQLVEDWVGNGWCHNFVVTIKFKGEESYHLLEPLKKYLSEHTKCYDLRHLHVNKNEVTAMGIVD